MTDSNATYTRDVVCDYPDDPGGTVKFVLMTAPAVNGVDEIFPVDSYTLVLNENGEGTISLPCPDNTGDASWLWYVYGPLSKERHPINLEYGAAAIELGELIALGSESLLTANLGVFDARYVNLTGDEMTGELVVDSTAKIGDVSGGNYTEFESDGTMRMVGDATVFDDIQISVSNVRIPPANAPSWTAYRGGQVLAFGNAQTNLIYFTLQTPHGYKHGSTLEVHVHVVPPDNTAGDVRWRLTYSMADINGVFPTETTEAVTQTIAANSQDKHLYFDISNLATTFSGVSGMGLFSLSRLGGDAADTYANDIYLLEVDIHYEMDTLGSRLEDEK